MVVDLYFSGLSVDIAKRLIGVGATCFLFSYADTALPITTNAFVMRSYSGNGNGSGLKFFLDSGAWSVLTGNKAALHINLQNYIGFCRKFGKYYTKVAALDVINDPEASMLNYRIMLREGIDYCIPTWHAGEPYEYLERYAKMSDFVAIGGLVKHARDQLTRVKVINKVLNVVKPFLRKGALHLFGISNYRLVEIFKNEIESIDTSGFVVGHKYGILFSSSGKKIPYIRTDMRIRRSIRHQGYMLDRYNAYQLIQCMKRINNRV